MRRRAALAGLLLGSAGAAARAAGATAGSAAGGGTAPAALDTVIAAVREDAARRAGVAVAATQLVSREPVTWRDGALGCPQPGRLYTQALVPGWRLSIEAAGRIWSYHGDTRGHWLHCPDGQAQSPADDPRS